MKKRFKKTYISSVKTYGCKTWAIKKARRKHGNVVLVTGEKKLIRNW